MLSNEENNILYNVFIDWQFWEGILKYNNIFFYHLTLTRGENNKNNKRWDKELK